MTATAAASASAVITFVFSAAIVVTTFHFIHVLFMYIRTSAILESSALSSIFAGKPEFFFNYDLGLSLLLMLASWISNEVFYFDIESTH